MTARALPAGCVLLSGRHVELALMSVRAAIAAQRREGLRVPVEVLELAEELATGVDNCRGASVDGRDGLPRLVDVSASLSMDLVDTKEMAQMLGCGERNARDLCVRQVFSTGRLVAGRWFAERAEVLARVERLAG